MSQDANESLMERNPHSLNDSYVINNQFIGKNHLGQLIM